MSAGRKARGVSEVLENEDVQHILRERFYTSERPAPPVFVEPSTEEETVAKLPTPPAVPDPSISEVRAKSPVVPAAPAAKAKPEHYKVICISMYTRDLARLDGIVAELKKRGFTKANRSAVLRAAMEQLNLDRIKKGL